MKITSIKPIHNPLYRTANSLDTAMAEIKAHLAPYDPNTVHSLVMMYHNSLLKAVCDEREQESHAGTGICKSKPAKENV